MWESRRERLEDRGVGEAKQEAAEFGPQGWWQLVFGDVISVSRGLMSTWEVKK